MTPVRLTYKLTKELPRNEEFGLSHLISLDWSADC
ncbi:hypothetical protein FJY68_03410 [candidate division WOR-3 bacterium]|uniref:Uncharacterized protein n=1 Tax=candidate division WOR-3 bacterium TaxID=2052148 RepID=A0A938BSN3_UNCW3|nr:hypothetical protein [candidate division WOR-3 bacterium]